MIKFIYAFVMTLFMTLSVSASNNIQKFDTNVFGIVIDESNEPLPGATVTLVGTNIAVATNADGQFALHAIGSDPRLTVTYIGMKPLTVHFDPASNRSIKIRMETSANIMNEVVVTGYQNLKREKATGSYQIITSENMEQRYTGSIVENLEGQVPGLVKDAARGGDDALVIRGVGTLSAATKPLIVVDGLPVEGSIEDINPYDIENITVLKDAAAAAIYGARASNGVIVITSKRAKSDRVSVDFNADLTISEKTDYDVFGWASASELIEIEKYNFDYVMSGVNPLDKENLMSYYRAGRFNKISPITRLLLDNYNGNLNDTDLKSTLDRLSSNNYVNEFKDAWLKNRITQQYNVAIRLQGNSLSSSIVLNYKRDNNGVYGEHSDDYSFKYNGFWQPAKFVDVNLGVNLLSQRAKAHSTSVTQYASATAFPAYMSMFNPDGTLADMENKVCLDNPVLEQYSDILLSEAYNLMNERGLGYARSRRSNTRAFITANFKLLPGWSASTHFQYEDIYYKSDALAEAETYSMRHRYNLYTAEDWSNYPNIVIKNNLPKGGQLDQSTSEGNYYTLRLQTRYENTFIDKHYIEILGGFEYRDNHEKTSNNTLLGYDDEAQSNQNGLINWYDLGQMRGFPSILDPNYTGDYGMSGAPDNTSIMTSDRLHRFYSVYFTGNYVFDNRYALSGSWRVDKTDLFGADPKYRGRPLWSIGLSWNAHNESFLRDVEWLDALKPRFSYGTTGNIDQSVNSFLTASLYNNTLTGNPAASLNTPPNDQLRWEKTQTYNIGIDFSVLGYRLSGSIDYYHKKGTDLLTVTDLDPTTGWTLFNINNGASLNKGVELQLNGVIVRPAKRNSLGLTAQFNMSYNDNKVTRLTHEYTNGYEQLYPSTLHESYPVHSIFSYDFAGIKMNEDGNPTLTWRDHTGEIHYTSVATPEFKKEDAVYSGGLDPKLVMALTPRLTYAGFSLSGMFNYYGGHYMKLGIEDYISAGTEYGYYKDLSGLRAVPASYLDYWKADNKEGLMPNGAAGGRKLIGIPDYMNTLVDHADYLKLRNIVLGYDFPTKWIKKSGINELRLRVQLNNVCTWARNKRGIDPESVSHTTGYLYGKSPRSYTFSLYVNF